ncbi:MAG: pilin [Micropruina sp.]
MNKIKLFVIAAVATLSLGLFVAPAANAACSTPKECISSGANSASGSGAQTDPAVLIKTVVNVLLYILGAIAVIMIIIGGIKYTTSNGDSSKVTSAKNTIMYAVVGLVVALFAYGIVNFVITQFT